MKVLHVIGDARLSGPSAAAFALAKALPGAGIETQLQCVPGGELESSARAAGLLAPVPLPVNPGSVFSMGAMKSAISGAAAALGADLIHCHRSPGHLAACRLRRRGGPSVVRSYHRGEAAPPPYFTRWLIGWRTSAVVTPSERACEAMRAALPEATVLAAPGIVDAGAFGPAPGSRDEMRAAMGAEPGDVLVGAVGRFASERRLDEFIFRFGDVSSRAGAATRGVVLGRGAQRTELETMAREMIPDDRLRVIESSDRFPEQLGALDIGVQMCPGSDGTCRTALEMMSSGLAVVVGSGGALSEIVSNGVTGRVVDLKISGALAEAISELAADEDLRGRLGGAARAEVARRNSPAAVASVYKRLYAKVLEEAR